MALTLVGGWLPASQAWNGQTHRRISARACHNMPPEMQAWRMYAVPLIRLSVAPDFWKDQDEDEWTRHFISLDTFPPGDTNEASFTLPRSAPVYGPGDNGSLPWTTMAVFDRLVSAMRSNDWLEATRLAGALGHYVGDLNMPLHVVRNFNGQLSGQFGLHTRWEGDMARRHASLIHAAPMPATVLHDPWQRLVDSLHLAYALSDDVMTADLEARWAVHRDYTSDRYYEILWTRTGDMYLAQITRAADDLASLWYTAWVLAGQPAIPAPPAEVPEHSVHGQERFLPENLPWPLLVVGLLLFIGLVCAMVSLVRRKPAASASPSKGEKANPQQADRTNGPHAQ